MNDVVSKVSNLAAGLPPVPAGEYRDAHVVVTPGSELGLLEVNGRVYHFMVARGNASLAEHWGGDDRALRGAVAELTGVSLPDVDRAVESARRLRIHQDRMRRIATLQEEAGRLGLVVGRPTNDDSLKIAASSGT